MDLDRLKAELTRDEGVRLHPYVDTVGKTTIGVGRNLTDCGISLEEAQGLLVNDINRAICDLDREFPWWRDLAEVRQRVLVNMAFNLGIAKLRGFPHTLTLVEMGRYHEAAVAMLDSRWATQVGPRALRLAAMMDAGTEPAGGTT